VHAVVCHIGIFMLKIAEKGMQKYVNERNGISEIEFKVN
jgi:hypothetical protein